MRSKKHYFLSAISKNVSFWLFWFEKKHLKKGRFFEKNHGLTPFRNRDFFRLLWELHFWGPKNFFFYPEYQKMFLYGFLLKKKHIRKRSIFWQKPWTNPFAKCRFFRDCENFTFEVQKAFFSIQNIKECFFLVLFVKKKQIRKRSIINKNNGLTPLKNINIFWLC